MKKTICDKRIIVENNKAYRYCFYIFLIGIFVDIIIKSVLINFDILSLNLIAQPMTQGITNFIATIIFFGIELSIFVAALINIAIVIFQKKEIANSENCRYKMSYKNWFIALVSCIFFDIMFKAAIWDFTELTLNSYVTSKVFSIDANMFISVMIIIGTEALTLAVALLTRIFYVAKKGIPVFAYESDLQKFPKEYSIIALIFAGGVSFVITAVGFIIGHESTFVENLIIGSIFFAVVFIIAFLLAISVLSIAYAVAKKNKSNAKM